MPTKTKAANAPKATTAPNIATTEAENEGTLVSVAKTIGHAAGKLAVKAGIEHPPATQSHTSKKPKLAPKNKPRLPRREKKALQKTTASRV